MSVPLPDGNDRRLDDFPQSGQTACVAVAGASSSRRVRRRFFRESTIATTARRTVRTINRNAVGTPRIRSGGNPASTTVRPTVVDLVPGTKSTTVGLTVVEAGFPPERILGVPTAFLLIVLTVLLAVVAIVLSRKNRRLTRRLEDEPAAAAAPVEAHSNEEDLEEPLEEYPL